jgi:hypothetical protein
VGSYSLAVRQLTPGGLQADYFDNQWLQGAPVVSTVDRTINFAWGTNLITPCVCAQRDPIGGLRCRCLFGLWR